MAKRDAAEAEATDEAAETNEEVNEKSLKVAKTASEPKMVRARASRVKGKRMNL